MLSKLAFRNAKRSIKDYLIYLITVVLTFSFILTFNLIGFSKEILEISSLMENFKYVLYVVNIFIVLAVCFLINYTIKFMFQKRSKEFGTYMLLGIPRKKIPRMFMFENIILGFVSFIGSIPLGWIFSQVASSVIMNIFDLHKIVTITFQVKAVVLSFLYFGIIYVIVLFLARSRFKKMNIYHLLYFEKQNEKNSIKKSLPQKFIFSVSLFLGILALILFDSQFKTVGNEPSLGIILISLILIILSIYGVTISLSEFILSVVLKTRSLKYKKDNLFITRTFASKVKTMSFSLGTLTVLVTLTLVSLNISSLFKGMFDYQLELNAPYDISIETEEQKVSQYLELIQKNYTVKAQHIYNTYENSNNSIVEKLIQGTGWKEKDSLIAISDYNKLLKMRGMSPVTLDKNQYMIHTSKEYQSIIESKSNPKKITLPDGQILIQKECRVEGYTTAWGAGYGYIVIVPDDVVKKLKVLDTHIIINTSEKTTEQFAKELIELQNPEFCITDENGATTCYLVGNIQVRGLEEANNNGFITITSFVCFYVAFIFTAIVGTILAIQCLSDSTKYKYRYTILNKLGVPKESLYKTIRKQLAIFFLFPLIYPTIISFSVIVSMNKIFKIALTTDCVYMNYYFLNLISFLILYFLYLTATYFGFKKNISESDSSI